MANIIDSRGYQLVPDITPFANGIGNLVSQRIAERLAQQAQGGDQQAMSQLAVRDPRAAAAIGGILQDQQAEQQRKHEMAYRVARGYRAAKDKAAYLAAASAQLRQAGMADMADDIDDDIVTFAKNPSQVDTEYDGIYSMFSPDSEGGDMFAPMAAMDAQGNPVFVQGSRAGGLQQLPGYRPYQPTIQEKTEADILKERAAAGIRVGTEGQIADIRTQQAVDQQSQTSTNERQINYVERGIAAAEQLPQYDRMLSLLDSVSTGNAANLAQSALNVFGVASADYQELDGLMKQAIIGNMKALGANPTEGERKFIMEATGDIRQSSGTLRRMLEKYKARAERDRNRGIRLARQRGDRDALDLMSGVDDSNNKTPPPKDGASIQQPKFLGFE